MIRLKKFFKTNKKISELLLFDFLKHLQQTKTEELNKIQYELQMINEDCKQVEDVLDTLKEKGHDLAPCSSSSSNDVISKVGVILGDTSAASATAAAAAAAAASTAIDATVAADSKDLIAGG